MVPVRWNDLVTLPVICLLLIGCTGKEAANRSAGLPKGSETAGPPASLPKLDGEWVVVADTSGRGDTGHLFVESDGSFKGDYKADNSTDTFSGTYTIADEEIAGQKFTALKLKTLQYNGKAAPYGEPIRLVYDPKRNILHDFLTVAYARPNEVERAKELYLRPKISGGVVKAPALTGRLVWEAALPGEDKGYFGLVAGEIVGGGDPEIVVADEAGFKVFDSTGRMVRQTKQASQLGRLLVLGQVAGKTVVVQFDEWGHEVKALAIDGGHRWTFSANSSGIDMLAPVRLDPNNTGYVIGYNGGGVELLGPDGKSRWRKDTDNNVWGVTGLTIGPNMPGLAVCVGSDNAIAFDSVGKKTIEFNTGEIGSLGAADLNGDGKEELLTLGDTVSSGLNLSVFDQTGSLKWSHKASATGAAFVKQPFLFGKFGKAGTLLGAADEGGILFFKPNGTICGTFKFNDVVSSAAVLHRKAGSDFVVLRLKNRLQCYELVLR